MSRLEIIKHSNLACGEADLVTKVNDGKIDVMKDTFGSNSTENLEMAVSLPDDWMRIRRRNDLAAAEKEHVVHSAQETSASESADESDQAKTQVETADEAPEASDTAPEASDTALKASDTVPEASDTVTVATAPLDFKHVVKRQSRGFAPEEEPVELLAEDLAAASTDDVLDEAEPIDSEIAQEADPVIPTPVEEVDVFEAEDALADHSDFDAAYEYERSGDEDTVDDPAFPSLDEDEIDETPLRLISELAAQAPDAFAQGQSDAMTTDVDTWHMIPGVSIGAQRGARLTRSPLSVLDVFRADPIAKGFDLLRTRLMRTIRVRGWKKIAIAAPTRQCGTTFTAVNLALSLSRVPGSRTVLMDMNQRTPGLADALSVSTDRKLNSFLAAETSLEGYFLRPSSTLALGLADAPCAYASELLHDPLTSEVLDNMIEELDPDLVLYDLPPILEYDDFAAFMPQVDGVLLVTDGTQTLPDHISACERIMDGQTDLLGVVLNRSRTSGQGDLVA